MPCKYFPALVFGSVMLLCGYSEAAPVRSFVFPVADNGLFATRQSQLKLAGYKIDVIFNGAYCSTNYSIPSAAECTKIGGTWMSGHNGIDLNGIKGGNTDCGYPVFAAAAGQVVKASPNGTWGNFIAIKHETRLGDRYTFYSHLQDITVNIGPVAGGQKIGTIGKTGSANNTCHLHFHIGTTADSGKGYYGPTGVPSTFVSPVSFIETYSYTYTPNLYLCSGPVSHDAGWNYSCGSSKTAFNVGETVYAMLRINNIKFDHRFKAVFFKDGIKTGQDQTTGWNVVGSSGWDKAFTYPVMTNLSVGSWSVKIYVDTGDGFPPQPLDQKEFSVTAPAYSYDGNGFSCLGPVTGGSATAWKYTCNNPATIFTPGDDVFALFRLDNIRYDHRYKAKIYKNGIYQYEQQPTTFNDVGPDGWDYGYFWPILYDTTAGTWRLDAYVDTGSGFSATPFGSVSFTVAAGSQYYSYDGNGTTCRGPVTGDVYTNWVYTCNNPGTSLPHGNDIYGLVSISNISRSHQFRVMAFRDGVSEFDWATDWNVIPLGGWWNYAYFWPVAEDAGIGNWSFYIFVRTDENGQRWTLIKQLTFDVY
jgi:hypothetical protein